MAQKRVLKGSLLLKKESYITGAVDDTEDRWNGDKCGHQTLTALS